MGKKRRAKVLAQQTFPAWKTASMTEHEKIGYAKVGSSLLQCTPYNELKPTTQNVYIKLLAISHDDKGFSISIGNMEKNWKVSKSSFRRALVELEAAGFIERQRPEHEDGELQYQTQIYEFSTKWKDRMSEVEKKKYRGA